MNTTDILQETFTSLSSNKVRSGLTILGIVIGIGSVIAMVSIGQGAKSSIQSSIEGLGSNLLTIMPGVIQPGRGIVSSGRGSAQTLKEEDLVALKDIQGIVAVSPESSRRFQVSAPTGNNTNTTVTGVLSVYPEVKNVAVGNGNFLTESDTRSYSRKAVLGATVAQDLFGDSDPLGQTIRIGGSTFRVVGILATKGGYGFSGPDDTIFVPLPTMQKILAGVDYLSTISISVVSKDQINNVKDSVTSALLTKHRVAEADFSIISLDDMLSTLSQVINTFTIFLASVAGISLVVGGIGIMNMMLTTVTERTREIGLRKAIGAKRRDINLQFLIESVALTFIGGFLGVVLGWLISFLITYFGILQTQVSLFSVFLSFGVSATIGIVFGYYPARRAASLNPIEALRYE